MKFAVIVEYGDDKEAVNAHHPAHREYLHRFLENGQLRAAGSFAEDAGSLWILDAQSAEAVEEIVKGHPSFGAGVLNKWDIWPNAFWMAQEAKDAS